MNKERLKNRMFNPAHKGATSIEVTNPTYTPTDEQVAAVFETLSEREQFVIKNRCSEPPMTLEAIGKILPNMSGVIGVNRERVRQIEAKALRKLRHPSRCRKLGFYHS